MGGRFTLNLPKVHKSLQLCQISFRLLLRRIAARTTATPIIYFLLVCPKAAKTATFRFSSQRSLSNGLQTRRETQRAFESSPTNEIRSGMMMDLCRCFPATLKQVREPSVSTSENTGTKRLVPAKFLNSFRTHGHNPDITSDFAERYVTGPVSARTHFGFQTTQLTLARYRRASMILPIVNDSKTMRISVAMPTSRYRSGTLPRSPFVRTHLTWFAKRRERIFTHHRAFTTCAFHLFGE
jgi:hypothetical protein